ncbi:alpha/beta hydrolase [Vibrio ulleungensis]|uniref:Alpha/beta hydrolase n=1 Tax=Vibrio ulleungensis TaxID=2807619 RepID=A0ABS2HHJ8_9VIBR|nr:alpha/beta hydrolase [Vibrio ulleungensis]MBM7035281.1 alpha/beta hydrolase [Vibrio ulleungensis]
MKLKKLNTIIPAILLTVSSSAAFANLSVVEKNIPTPTGISAELAQIIENRQIPPALPTPTNNQEWHAIQQAFDASGNEMAHAALERLNVTYEAKQYAGVDTFFVTPETISPEYKDKWLIHIHGGAFVFGGADSALREAIWLANGLGAQVISVDYRQPPLHPFPAAIDDTVAVWKELTKTQAPESTAIFGTSAGGNLTLATTLKIQELGLPTPGALFVGTPAVDLKETSDTWHTLKGLDPLGQREGLINGAFEVYSAGENLDNPLISPIYAEIDSFPPTILISGTRDLLLSDTVRMHRLLRAADVDAQLHIYDGQSHGDYLNSLLSDVPESDDAIKEIESFFNKYIN